MAVRPVMWQGWCDRCGHPAGGARESEQQAQQDVDECPCLDDSET